MCRGTKIGATLHLRLVISNLEAVGREGRATCYVAAVPRKIVRTWRYRVQRWKDMCIQRNDYLKRVEA